MAAIRNSAWCFPNYFPISDKKLRHNHFKYLDKVSNVNFVTSSFNKFLTIWGIYNNFELISDKNQSSKQFCINSCRMQEGEDKQWSAKLETRQGSTSQHRRQKMGKPAGKAGYPTPQLIITREIETWKQQSESEGSSWK